MTGISFEWDAAKASINKKKHGISFDEAKTVFFDEHAKIIHDPDHSNDEERFIILGLSVVTAFLWSCIAIVKKTALSELFQRERRPEEKLLNINRGEI